MTEFVYDTRARQGAGGPHRPPQPAEARRRTRSRSPARPCSSPRTSRATSTATPWSSTAACPRRTRSTIKATAARPSDPRRQSMTDSPISTQKHHDILVVTSNNPPVNALGAAVRAGAGRGDRAGRGRRRDQGGGHPLRGPDLLRRRRHHRIRQAAGDAVAARGGRPHRELLEAGGRRDPRHRARRRARGRARLPLSRRRSRRRSSAFPRSSSACSPAPAAPSACRASPASPRRSRWSPAAA